jgi:hypothetical protein
MAAAAARVSGTHREEALAQRRRHKAPEERERVEPAARAHEPERRAEERAAEALLLDHRELEHAARHAREHAARERRADLCRETEGAAGA